MAMLRTLCFVIFVCLGVFLSTTNGLDSYATDYQRWEQLYRVDSSFSECGDCLKIAGQKFDKVKDKYHLSADEHRYPVMIVNLYTQDTPGIYNIVNLQLRRETLTKVWSLYVRLLADAIDILSPLVNKACQRYTVYRGQGCHFEKLDIGQTIKIRPFWSTSFNAAVALGFLFDKTCTTFIKIESATGLPVSNFSQFATEKEVLLRYDSHFIVQKNLNNSNNLDGNISNAITTELQKILQTQKTVSIYLDLKMLPYKKMKRDVRNVRYTTVSLPDDAAQWKSHLQKEYDGEDGAFVPKCLVSSATMDEIDLLTAVAVVVVHRVLNSLSLEAEF